MIIATAGHVDHGKTTLVKALTGVDTDRLKEEKLRGMSIEPGFAYADLGGAAPIGFVDVPGHERFVRNMLAGVAAVDFVLLVVAADDGPMPQTMEHLAILELLGVGQGAVVLTKIDRVAPERVLQAQADVRAALASSALGAAPIFAVAAQDGTGIEALRSHLAAVAAAFTQRAVRGNFRLAVDRCFSLSGTGLVVTGAVVSGMARTGDQLLVSPQGIGVRVRGIHVHNRPADSAQAGWRCALNLAGADLKRISIERGDWIVAPAAHAPTERFDVRIRVPASQPKALAHWTPVHLHSGAAAVNARVALLQGLAIAPGGTALAQLVTDRPIGVLRGDRFILRDQSAQHTIAGGVVLDPFGPVRGRAKPVRIACLAAMEQDTPDAALGSLLELQTDGVPLDSFTRAWNLTANEAAALHERHALVVFCTAGEALGISAPRWHSMRERILQFLREWHTSQSDSIGPAEAVLVESLAMRTQPAAWRAVMKAMREDGSIVREGISLRLASHRAQLAADDSALLERVSEVLRASGLRPPIVGELAKMLALEQPQLVDFLERAARLGHLVRVAKNRFFLPNTLSDLAGIAATLIAESEPRLFDAAAFRDRSGIGRNLTIEVLEFMDRVRITRYAGGKRRLVS